jgi:perosamine synthetase
VQSDCSTFSFYANKTITTGEGGMVVFKNKELFKKSLILRNQGRNPQDNSFLHIYKGFNFRMTNMQAALGYAQMFKIEGFVKNKKKIFKIYNKYLSKNKSIIFLPVPKNTENSYWLYTIRLKNFSKRKRDLLIKKLKDKGIETRPGFFPLSEMAPYKKYSKKNYRNSKKIAFSSISLPTSSDLKEKDVILISKILLKELNEKQN